MRTGKTLAFAIAALTAAAPLSYAGVTLNNIPAVYAEGTAAVRLPEWVPTSFDSALEFRNTYGATHIEDELLCVVYLEGTDDERFSVSEGSMIDYGTYGKMEPGIVTTELYHHTFDSKHTEYPLRFEVVVYKGIKAGNFTVLFCDKEAVLTNCVQPVYEFTVTDKLDIEETDLHRWVPDCVTEYNDYKAHYGEVGLYEGKYLTFCMESSEGTPYSWTDFGHNTDGGILGNYGAFDCTPVTDIPPIDGGERNIINVYFPEKDGPATVSWKLAQSFKDDDEGVKTLSANCVITDNASAILLDNNLRIRFVDNATGKLLDFPNEKELMCLLPTIAYETKDDYVYADLALMPDSNPFIWKTTAHRSADIFNLDLSFDSLPEGYTIIGDYLEITNYENGAADYTFKISKSIRGDISHDGTVSILDAVTLQSWLLGNGNKLTDIRAADVNGDYRINVIDLCRLKELLLNGDQKTNAPEEPDNNADHFNAEYIRTSDLGITYPDHMVINSQKEFEDFLNTHGSFGYSDDTKELFAEAKKKYTEDWFVDHSLFIAFLEEGSGSVKHTVTNVTNDAVTIESYSPLVGTADMAYWCILVEGDKSLKFTDDTKLVINHVNEAIT